MQTPRSNQVAGDAVGHRKVILLYTIYQILFSLLLWTPIFFEYQKISGLTDQQAFHIQTLYYIAFLLCEIPTGFFADKFGYRRSLTAGAIFLAIANAMPTVWVNYTGFLWHFMILAFARSLNSGASSAYLYEYLKQTHGTSEYKAFEGKARAWTLVARVFLFAPAGMLFVWNPTIPYWATLACSLGAVVYALRLPRLLVEDSEEKIHRTKGLLHSYVPSLKQLWHSPFLATVMVQGIAIFVLARILMVNLFQPLLKSALIPVAAFGAIMAGQSLVEAYGSYHPHKLRRWLGDFNAVYALTLVIAVSLVVVTLPFAYATVAGLTLFSLAFGFAFPIQKQLMNDAIAGTEGRATLLSIESLIDRLMTSIALMPVGIMVAQGRMHELFWYLAGATAVLATMTSFVARRLRRA